MLKVKLHRWILMLGLAAMLLSACGAPKAPALHAAPVDVEQTRSSELASNLDVAEVQALYAAGEIVIVDVREKHEFDAGHIPGARLIPLGELPKRVSDVPRDETVVIVCRSGNRSAQAHQFLLDQGFTNVHNMQGGMIDWAAAGFDIEK